MEEIFAKGVLVDVMAEGFQDVVRLAHGGAAVFNNALFWAYCDTLER